MNRKILFGIGIVLAMLLVVISGIIFMNQDAVVVEKQACEEVGGVWREFANSCVDSCEYNRNPEIISCAQVLTMGCDCGENRCWNGDTCVDI